MCIPPRPQGGPERDSGINEAILAAIWNEQAPLRGPMWDCEGKPVAVVYRGRWTAGSGPDFEGAMLSMGEGSSSLVTGSVEIHLRCADWWAHGHDADPRYNSVALHVVMWPQGVRPVTRADGASVPTLVLADYITMPAGELMARVGPLLANLGTLSEEPCWQRTQEWPLEKLLQRIDDAGDSRLIARAAVMEADIEACGSADEVFYRGLMESLGYSANREPMKALASLLPIGQLLTLPLGANEEERAVLLESVFLGAAGLLPSQRPDMGALDYVSAEYAEEAEEIWRANAPLLGLPLRGSVEGWRVDRVRPANSPPRRLAAGARLMSRLLWEQGGMLGPFVGSAGSSRPEELAKGWSALLTMPAEGYWSKYADFGQPLGSAGKGGAAQAALVGESRAGDMVINVLLPVLTALGDREDVPRLRECAMRVYGCYPKLSENRITRAMAEEALGPRRDGAIKGARRQQGLIHLYRLYCEARRCYECPLSGLGR